MYYELAAVVAVLSLLSLIQRVIPWLLYKRLSKGEYFTKLFDFVAVSAFAALMVDNIQAFNYQNLLPLLPALIVAYKFRNLGATVLVAMLFSLALSAL